MTEQMVPQESVLRKYAHDELSKFKNQEDVKNFLETLHYSQITDLSEWLSRWRKNGVHQFVVDGPSNWHVAKIHISKIVVGKVNDEVNDLLEKNKFLLESIAQDKAVCEHREFEPQGKLEIKALIAQKFDEMFILQDGVHRAIRAACDGTIEFTLLYY